MSKIFKSTFKERFISHIKPYKYKDKNNEIVGKYKIGYFNIEFTPIYNTYITDTIRALIDISNKHKVPVYVTFNGVHVEVAYPTNYDDTTIQNIIDTYHKMYNNKRTELQKTLDKTYVKA